MNFKLLFITMNFISVSAIAFFSQVIHIQGFWYFVEKKQNFAGFSGANSRKNRPISQHFRGKKVKIRGTISRFREIFTGEKSKFAEKSAHFAGFLRKKVNFRRIFGGKFLGKSADFTGNFGGKLRQQTISKRQPISLVFHFFGKFR